jgi:hypothetical protein
MKKLFLTFLLLHSIHLTASHADFARQEREENSCCGKVKGALVCILGFTINGLLNPPKEQHVTAIVFGEKNYVKKTGICPELGHELREFAYTVCPKTSVDISFSSHNYAMGTCTIPDLGIVDQIEEVCVPESKEIKTETPDKGPSKLEIARAKLRTKIKEEERKRGAK